MAGVQRRRCSSAKNKKLHRMQKTRNYIKDHDQIHDNLKNQQKFEDMQLDECMPGLGQHYCISCARYFDSDNTLNVHKATKKHKRMLKRMLDEPYTHKQAYQAGK